MKNRRKLSLTITGIIFTVLLATALNAGFDGFEVVSQSNQHTEIEFQIPEYTTYEFEHNGVKYTRFHHPLHGLVMEEGLPELLSFSFLLTVPAKGTVSLGNLNIQEMTTESGINVFPSQGFNLKVDDKKGFLMDEDFYAQDTYYPFEFTETDHQDAIIQISPPAIMRDMRLVTISINPFSYNPARQQLTTATKLTLRIDYQLDTPGENELTQTNRRRSRVFEEMQRQSVVNHEQFRNPGTRNRYQAKSMIVVHHHTDNAQYVASLNNYLNWKRDKGFEVTAINTAQYQTTQTIKNFIQTAYDEWENPPEFVVLIGDLNSALRVPMWVDPQPDAYEAGNANTDHPYSLLAGDDLLSDVIVGRISIGNATQLATFWNKLANYEKTPFMANTNWYENNLIVGQTNALGASALFTTRYINDVIKRYNSNFNNTEILSPPYPGPVQTALNNGVSFAAIRCWYSLGGWNPTDDQYTNGFRLPHIIALTCMSMDFVTNGGLNLGNQFKMGTPNAAKGPISVIGMSHVTDTAYNNLLTAAMFDGLFIHDMWTMGEAKVYSKLEHYRAFWNSHRWRARHYFYMLNLKGDPSLDVWKGVPKVLNADYPEELPPGSNSILITITDADEAPIKDAWVTIRKGTDIGDEEVFATGYTNEDGQIVHYFSSTVDGTIKVTVTKNGYIPHNGNFDITGTPAVSFNRLITNQDFTAGNEVNFVLTVRNHREAAVNGVNGTLAVNSEFVTVEQNNSAFGNVNAGAEGESVSNYRIDIAPETPAAYRCEFTLTVTDNNQNSWVSRFHCQINNGKLDIVRIVIEDDDDGVLDPMEEARIMVHLRNNGQIDMEEIYGFLTGGRFGLTIVSDTAYFGDIERDDTVTSRNRHFAVTTSGYILPGMIYPLELHLFNEDGFHQSLQLDLNIGTVTVDDPLGPCPYGYWIYDSGDEFYMEAPEYEWIEIFPPLGGQGVNTNLTADYNNDQNSRTLDLPFTFKFYGVEYDVVTISANGWITFIETIMATQRNWRLPGPLGPDPIVAAFWDNLGLSQGGVFTWYDQEEHRFIIQWQNATNAQMNAPETFQIILYDPEYYFTSTNDGPIKIQYKVFNNVNNRGGTPGGNQPQFGEWGNYATIGIGDHTGKYGLEYTFNNEYPTAARRLANETAIYITTGSLGFTPYVVIDNFSYDNAGDNIPKFGETAGLNFRLMNLGGIDATAVTALLASTDEYVTIVQGEAEFGDIDSQETSNVDDAFTIRLADNIPDGHRVHFTLSISSAENISWNSRLHIDVAAPKLITGRPLVYDPFPGGNNNGLVDPGETITVFLPIRNDGGANSPAVNLNITARSELVDITAISEAGFAMITSSATMYPAISMTISPDAEAGTGLVFDYLYATGEYEFTGTFLLGVGGIVPAQIGTGNAVSAISAASPINIYYRTLRGQTIYTVEEMHHAGLSSSGSIASLGFYVETSPFHPLPNFIVRMRHTAAEDASQHVDGPYTTVYTNPTFAPVPNGWYMLDLNPPFEWNGVDNILVDTAFAPVANWNGSGQVRIYQAENGYRFGRADAPDQTNIATNSISADKPQIRFTLNTGAGNVESRPDQLSYLIIDEDTIRLNWQEPLAPNGLMGYNIYRNGHLLNEEIIAETEYEDTEFERLLINYYYVTALYEDADESLPSNIVSVDLNFSAKPRIEPAGGAYQEPVQITITTLTADAEIRYTLDGSEPTADSNLYQEPFIIDYYTELKAKTFKEDLQSSETATEVYHILYPARNLRAAGSLERMELNWDVPWTPEDLISSSDAEMPSQNSLSLSSESQNSRYNNRTRRASRDKDIRQTQNRETLRGYNVYRSFEQEEFIMLTPRPISVTTFVDNNLSQGSYRYYIVAIYEQGEALPSNILHTDALSVEDEFSPVAETRLLNAYPNPFNPETIIGFTLKEEDRVVIEIFNISGRKVKTLVADTLPAGSHRVVWKGEDENGRRLGSGIYFYRMTTTAYSETKKALMLK